ncbi:putative serine/threonine-protein kinase tsuA, partial [Frankliniella fusca]
GNDNARPVTELSGGKGKRSGGTEQSASREEIAMTKTSYLCLALALTALSAVCLGTPLAAPEVSAESPTRHALQDALASTWSPETFRVDVQQLDGSENAAGVRDVVRGEGEGEGEGEAGDEKQLSPATQSFLSTLGTALGPIVGAIVGPLLTNIGQNLSAGSGAQAIAQLQQAAAAVAAQQQGGAPSNISTAPAEVSVTPPPRPPPRPSHSHHSRPSSARPPAPPARPVRPNSAARPAPTTTTPSPPPKQSFDAFVLDVPGKGPFLFLMTPNVTAAEQTAAIQQAQQQAAQLLAVNGQSSPIGAVASLIGSTTAAPRPQTPQVTKPTSVGPLPVQVPVQVPGRPRPLGTTPSPLPSYHSLYADDVELEQQQGGEEVAVADSESDRDHDDVKHDVRERTTKDDESDYSSQSFLERLFPEII